MTRPMQAVFSVMQASMTDGLVLRFKVPSLTNKKAWSNGRIGLEPYQNRQTHMYTVSSLYQKGDAKA